MLMDTSFSAQELVKDWAPQLHWSPWRKSSIHDTHTQKFVESLCLCSFEGKIPDAVFHFICTTHSGGWCRKDLTDLLDVNKDKDVHSLSLFKFQWVVAKVICTLSLSSVRPGKVKRMIVKMGPCQRSIDMLHWNDLQMLSSSHALFPLPFQPELNGPTPYWVASRTANLMLETWTWATRKS